MSEPEKIVLGSGPDGRFVAEWLARSQWRTKAGETGKGGLMMELAQKHGRPIQELKNVIRTYKIQQGTSAEALDRREEQKRQAWENRECTTCGSRDDLQKVADWDYYGYVWRCGPCRSWLAGED